MLSWIALAEDGERIELGVVGREGFIGIPLLLGTDRTRHIDVPRPVEGGVLPTTQQFPSLMLEVNRNGLNAVVGTFVRDGLIETRCGNITICDRAGSLAVAGAAYSQPEAEDERLLHHVRPPS